MQQPMDALALCEAVRDRLLSLGFLPIKDDAQERYVEVAEAFMRELQRSGAIPLQARLSVVLIGDALQIEPRWVGHGPEHDAFMARYKANHAAQTQRERGD